MVGGESSLWRDDCNSEQDPYNFAMWLRGTEHFQNFTSRRFLRGTFANKTKRGLFEMYLRLLFDVS